MNFEDVIRNRTATRKFKDENIERELLFKILDAGNIAPTAKNIQPQVIYVVESKEALEKIDNITPCRYNAPVCLLVCSNKDIAYQNGDYSSYEMDACIVATHMMLEATNLGVDNIWIRHFDSKEVQKEFEIDKNIIPICIIDLGYKTDDYVGNPLHNKRKDLSEIVKFI